MYHAALCIHCCICDCIKYGSVCYLSSLSLKLAHSTIGKVYIYVPFPPLKYTHVEYYPCHCVSSPVTPQLAPSTLRLDTTPVKTEVVECVHVSHDPEVWSVRYIVMLLLLKMQHGMSTVVTHMYSLPERTVVSMHSGILQCIQPIKKYDDVIISNWQHSLGSPNVAAPDRVYS